MRNEVVWFLMALLFVGCSSSYAQEKINDIVADKKVNSRVVKEWTKSVNKINTVHSSTTYIVKKSGGKDSRHISKHRDAIVWIPGTTDLSKDLIVVYWFHGHWGYVPQRTFENRTLKQFVPLVGKHNLVVVIPEMPWSVHTNTPTKRNSLLWQQPGSFLKFDKQVRAILVKHNLGNQLGAIDYKIVGHSAGGSTIKRLGLTGDLCELNPSDVVWSDSSYGRWLDAAWFGCLGLHPDIQVTVLVVKWGRPWKSATLFVSGLKSKPKNLVLKTLKQPKWSHKLIGDNSVKLSNLIGESNAVD